MNSSSVKKPGHVFEDLPAIRLRILNTLLTSGTLIGVPLYLISLIPAIKNGLITSAILYTVILVWVMTITVAKKMPYLLRAGSLAALPFILGILNLIQSGFNLDAGLFFLTLIVLTGVLLGLKAGLYALAASALIISGAGFLIVTHQHEPTLMLPQDDPLLWAVGGFVFLLVGSILTLSITTLSRGLSNSLKNTQSLIQQTIEEREISEAASANLERRLVTIRTAADISRIISGVLEPKQLLQEVVELLKDRFQLYYVGIFLVDERQRFAILEAGTGEAGQKMIGENYKLPIGETSMIGWTILRGQARIALDVGMDAVRFANPHLPMTRSELALPIIAGERTLGAITVQSEKEAAFDQDDITALQGITDTLSIALENARLFKELEQNLIEIRNLHGQYLLEAWSSKTRGIDQGEFNFQTTDRSSQKGIAISVPLALREQTIGQLQLERIEDWSPDERTLIEAVATQAALALENARLLEDSQQTALRERLTADIANKIWASQNIDTILQTAIRELGRALRADEATIELDATEH
jgi:GAF domain-containing protein